MNSLHPALPYSRRNGPAAALLRAVRTGFPLWAVLLVTVLFAAPGAAAGTPGTPGEVKVLLTSNLQGRFSLEVENQDRNDLYLLLGQAMLSERQGQGNVFYLDLGNAFYPGVLSKFSFGKVVMQYFENFGCEATLVSSRDLELGVDSLEVLREGRRTRLLSSNILRDGSPVFEPYVTLQAGSAALGILAISSKKILIDIAEKNLARLTLESGPAVLAAPIHEIQAKGIRHLILLSGLNLEDTINLLALHPEIQLAVCGGDNTGKLYGMPGTRVELSTGQSVVLLPDSEGYYVLDLLLNGSLQVRGLKRRSLEDLKREAAAAAAPRPDPKYLEFTRNLTLWKEKLKQEEETVVSATAGRPYSLDSQRLAFLLRDRFDAEVAVVDQDSIKPRAFQDGIRASEVMDLVNQDFNLFVYKLTGRELIQVQEKEKGLIVNGLQDKQIQGYPVEDQRRYRVVSTQGVFERAEALLGTKIRFENQWVTVTDVVLADLREKRVVFLDDFGYLDRRFRATLDLSLSNYFDNSSVNRSGDTDVPPGEPSSDYRQWGMENEAVLRYYNSRHLFSFTPYMRYERQGDDYNSNLLRGSLYYSYNLHKLVRPYQKTTVETVVEEVDGRPILVRETVGVTMLARWWSANVGLGFEKKVQDPSESPFYGIEAQGKLEYEPWERVRYLFNLDSFFAMQSFDADRSYLRTEIVNGLAFALNSYLDLALKYRWYYYNPAESDGEYIVNQILTSLDVKLDTKLW